MIQKMFDHQKSAYEKYQQNQMVGFVGSRGTGKSLLAHHIACEEVKAGKKVCIYNINKKYATKINYEPIKRYDKNIAKLIDFKSFKNITAMSIRGNNFEHKYDVVICDEYDFYNLETINLIAFSLLRKNSKAKTKYIFTASECNKNNQQIISNCSPGFCEFISNNL